MKLIGAIIFTAMLLWGCDLMPDSQPGTMVMWLYPCDSCGSSCMTEGELCPDEDYDAYYEGLAPTDSECCLIMGRDLIDAAYIWITHYNDGTVSKMDLRSGECIARYRVGLWGTSTDHPSRTAVDGNGNVYIANRAFASTGSVTKIAGDPRFCEDREGDTIVTTSSSCDDVLALDTDDCVLWTKPLPEAGICSQGSLNAVVIDFGGPDHREGYPWVGSICNNTFYMFDPDTGNVLDTVEIDIPPFGVVLDSKGWAWSTCYGCADGALQAFHTQTKVKQTVVTKPAGVCGPGWGYGIAVDLENRIWVGSWHDSEGKPCRFDPLTYTWFAPPGNDIECAGHLGIAAHPDGTMWSACREDGTVWRFNVDDGEDRESFDMGCSPHGVSVDDFGMVWVANNACQRVTRIDPASDSVETFATGGQRSLAFSDFSGWQRSLRQPRGTWLRDFERCDETPMDKWCEIEWEVETPSDSRVTIYSKSADDHSDLPDAPEVILAEIPSDASPVNLELAFIDERTYLGKYLRIAVILEQSIDGQSPEFCGIRTTFNCY